jgi:hypothetical protein
MQTIKYIVSNVVVGALILAVFAMWGFEAIATVFSALAALV